MPRDSKKEKKNASEKNQQLVNLVQNTSKESHLRTISEFHIHSPSMDKIILREKKKKEATKWPKKKKYVLKRMVMLALESRYIRS